MRRRKEPSEVICFPGRECPGNQIRRNQGDEFGGELLGEGYEWSRRNGDIGLIGYAKRSESGR